MRLGWLRHGGPTLPRRPRFGARRPMLPRGRSLMLAPCVAATSASAARLDRADLPHREPEHRSELERGSNPGRAGRAVAPTKRRAAARRAPLGLLPHFTKDPKHAHRPIDGRAETLATSRMFRDAYAARRCLVPHSGFYEWKAVPGGPKQPYAIGLNRSLAGFERLQQHAATRASRNRSCRKIYRLRR